MFQYEVEMWKEISALVCVTITCCVTLILVYKWMSRKAKA